MNSAPVPHQAMPYSVHDNHFSNYTDMHPAQFEHHLVEHNAPGYCPSNDFTINGHPNENGFHTQASVQQQQQRKLELAHHQQQQQLQQLQQRLRSPMPSGHPQPNSNTMPTAQVSAQQAPKRTTWTFTQIPSH
eukprot:TRINITY_DN1135_c0_g1_i2.p1 TRINITY_DN1135_c0_g1~~TRINITY_DN1135_c0_g1_i2.p1  ORF type:complete len:133 (-),score=18.11 TRINITY_DN1135_c0_g1_i2:263-661(-)